MNWKAFCKYAKRPTAEPELVLDGMALTDLRSMYHEIFDGSIDNEGNYGATNAKTLDRDDLIKDILFAAEYTPGTPEYPY